MVHENMQRIRPCIHTCIRSCIRTRRISDERSMNFPHKTGIEYRTGRKNDRILHDGPRTRRHQTVRRVVMHRKIRITVQRSQRNQVIKHGPVFYFGHRYEIRPPPQAVFKINHCFRNGRTFFKITAVTPTPLSPVTEFRNEAVRPAPRNEKILKIPEHQDFPVRDGYGFHIREKSQEQKRKE